MTEVTFIGGPLHGQEKMFKVLLPTQCYESTIDGDINYYRLVELEGIPIYLSNGLEKNAMVKLILANVQALAMITKGMKK